MAPAPPSSLCVPENQKAALDLSRRGLQSYERPLVQSHTANQHSPSIHDLVGFAIGTKTVSDVARENAAVADSITICPVTTFPVATVTTATDLNSKLRRIQRHAVLNVRCLCRWHENKRGEQHCQRKNQFLHGIPLGSFDIAVDNCKCDAVEIKKALFVGQLKELNPNCNSSDPGKQFEG